MPWYSNVYHLLAGLFTIKDLAQIALISTAVYYFSLWLKKDRQKNLLFSFYGYCAAVFGCYAAGLQTLTLLLFFTSPIALMLFILFHQELLQRNFIALAAINTAEQDTEDDWLETVIRACLVALNNNKTVCGIIEHRDSLAAMLTADIPLYADVQQSILAMTLDSATYDQEKMLWLNAQGKILGINCHWHASQQDVVTSHGVNSLTLWQQEALFFTHKTDAIVFFIAPLTRTFTLVAQGKIVEHISATHALQTIKKFLNAKPNQTEGIAHEVQSKKQSQEQRNT